MARCPDLDTEHGLRLCRGDAARYAAFLGRLIAKLDSTLPSLEHLLSQDDRTGLRRLAHEIRGASSNLGALRVAAAAEALEVRQLDGLDAEALAGLVDGLREAIRALGRELRASVHGL